MIFDVIDVDKYFLNSNLNEIVRTEYFKSHDIIYCTDDTPHLVEIKSIKNLLNYVKQNRIPHDVVLDYAIGETMCDYNIPFDSDSE